MTTKNILVPTDFSKEANYAFDLAIKLAATLTANVYLFHNSVLLDKKDLPSENKLREKMIIKNMEQIARQSKNENVKIFTSYQSGIISESILKQVESNNIDLIVMGTNGKGNLSDQIIGSNTVKVMRKASIPTLIVKSKFEEEHIKDFLFASSYSDELRPALIYACQLAQELNAKLHFTEINLDPYKTVNAETIKNKLMGLLGKNECAARGQIVENSGHSLSKGIQEVIDQTKVQVVAMACHHKSIAPKLFNTFITEAVLYQVNKPILVLPV